MKDLKFLDNKDSLVMTGDKELFYQTLYLDSKYNVCNSSKGVYKELIKMEKAKGIKHSEEGVGDIDTPDEDDIDIDVEEDKIAEDSEGINNKIKSLVTNLEMAKVAGEDESTIGCIEIDDDKDKIPMKDDVLILNVTINQVNNKVTILIQDENENTLIKIPEQDLDSTKVNHLDLHFNFKDYLKEENETLKYKDMKINVNNKVKDFNNVVANIYIEKSSKLDDLDVEVTPKNGEITVYKRDDNGEIKKIGPLYNIEVRIALLDNLNEGKEYKELTSEEKAKVLFEGHTSKNINITEEEDT